MNQGSMILLLESDIRSFLQPSPVKEPLAFKQWASTVVLALFACGITFVLLNLPAFIEARSHTNLETTAVFSSAATPAPAEATVAPASAVTPDAASVTQTAAVSDPSQSIPDNTVSIPNLGISVPVTWSVPLDDITVQANLKKGAVHIAGTALPGDKGMVVITAHSSNYPWISGNYNTIFAPLQKLAVGSEVSVAKDGVTYTYKITKQYVIQPTDVNVLSDGSSTGIRLITCTPVGTSLRRLVVEGAQVSPDPSGNRAFTQANFSAGTVPGAR